MLICKDSLVVDFHCLYIIILRYVSIITMFIAVFLLKITVRGESIGRTGVFIYFILHHSHVQLGKLIRVFGSCLLILIECIFQLFNLSKSFLGKCRIGTIFFNNITIFFSQGGNLILIISPHLVPIGYFLLNCIIVVRADRL